jgi:hypothetical protein
MAIRIRKPKKTEQTMKEITTGNGRFLFVPIPKGSWEHGIERDELNNMALTYFNYQTTSVGGIDLPFGSYTLLFTTDNVTEEQAAQVVDKVHGCILDNHIGFENYHDKDTFYLNAIDSFHSFKLDYSLTAPRYAVLKIN